jgi:glutathione S-transferase
MITVTAFKQVPDFARGLVRDLRVRWALEEAGIDYDSDLIAQETKATSAFRTRQPFGQVPVFEENGFVLFESGAIVLHIGARSEALLPKEPAAKARATTWVIAALNTVEPVVQQLANLDLSYSKEEWAKLRRPGLEEIVKRRLAELSTWLGDRDYLEGRFTAGDLMMTTVLRILRHTDLVEAEPKLRAYKARCEARPAFQRALAAQMEAFEPA